MPNNCKFIVYNGNPMDLMVNQCKMDDNKTDFCYQKEDASDNEEVNASVNEENEECVHSDSDDEILECVQKLNSLLEELNNLLEDLVKGSDEDNDEENEECVQSDQCKIELDKIKQDIKIKEELRNLDIKVSLLEEPNGLPDGQKIFVIQDIVKQMNINSNDYQKDKELAHQCEKLDDYLKGIRNEYYMDDIQEFKSTVCNNLNSDKHKHTYDKSTINLYLKVCTKLIIKCNKSIDRLQEQIKKEKEYQEERNDAFIEFIKDKDDWPCCAKKQKSKKQKLEEDEVQLEPELLKEIQTLQQLADIDDVDVIMLLKSSANYDGLIKNIKMNFSTARLYLEMKELRDLCYSEKVSFSSTSLHHEIKELQDISTVKLDPEFKDISYNRYRVICKLYKMLSIFDKQVRYLNDDYMSDIQYLGGDLKSLEIW
nr:uncharacterized protein LOC124815475 [Hydra vulgaris]